MSSVLLIIATVLALLLVLLAVPLKVVFRVDHIKEIKGQMSFQWLFGLVRFRIGIPGTTKAAPKRKRTSTINTRKTKKRKPGAHARNFYTLVKQSEFRRRAIRFIKDILCVTHASDLYLRLRVGLSDPADTGRLWALLGPISGIATNLCRSEVLIEPEFMNPMLEVETHGEFRLIPLQFIALATAFVVSPTTLRAWRALLRSNA